MVQRRRAARAAFTLLLPPPDGGPVLLDSLRKRLAALVACRGASCRS